MAELQTAMATRRSKNYLTVQKQKQVKAKNNRPNILKADGVDITYYTDPLCCWSWALEPQWRKLLYEFGEQINVRYCMGGLLLGWNNFHDPVNSVSRPIQMGPVWMHAAQLSGMPIDHNIWMKDPPASSYPACIAVKCAELQSAHFGERYLRLLREAVMIKGRNIGRQPVLIEVAEQLHQESETFDVARFTNNLTDDTGLEAFRKDLQEVRYHNISRFPTLIIRKTGQKSMMISGHRPYQFLTETLTQISPGIQKDRIAANHADYTSFFKSIVAREIQEGLSSI